MKEKPILFNTEMVKAILSGRKTQTRRLFKLPKWAEWHNKKDGTIIPKNPESSAWYFIEEMPNPYGSIGDILWVRETFSTDFAKHYPYEKCWYKADDDRFHDIETRDGIKGIYSPESKEHVPFKWHPSIHMPKELIRIKLQITNVRAEILNAISHDDAIAEGVNSTAEYLQLWEEINGLEWRYSTLWVWVIEFKRVY